jgi:hypothetical protein
MQKTKTAVMKETVKCSHNLEHGCASWYTIDTDATLKQYTDDFREYEYDLCKSCIDTVVNGTTIEKWIAKEKELVNEVLICRFEANDSGNKGRDAEAQKFYDNITAYESAIKTIRRNMVNRICGEMNLSNDKLETKLQALIEEKDKWSKALDEVDTELRRRKSSGIDSRPHPETYSQPFQDACQGIYGCELEIDKIKAIMKQYKKYSNINFPESTLLHVTDFPDPDEAFE